MRALRVTGEALDKKRRQQTQQSMIIGEPLPPANQIRGVEFTEFVTSAAESTKLVAVLEGLGFVRVARHRTKDVDLFRQNGVNIVINQEQDGFAHSFYLVHGTSVCAFSAAN